MVRERRGAGSVKPRGATGKLKSRFGLVSRMLRLMPVLLIQILLAMTTRIAIGGPEERQEAIESYNSAVEDISDTLRSYSTCVSDIEGNDDCSTEFRRLSSAQDDFESAVSSYESECG